MKARNRVGARQASPDRSRPPGNLALMSYQVRTEVFEGPFDLLLHLITAEEVDVWSVSLSSIVDAYLAEVERMQSLDLDVATEFLLIAATLVELKCRRLLPAPSDVDLDEDLALFEERDLLLARLLECKTFAGASRALIALESAAARSVPRTAGLDERLAGLRPDLLAGVTPEMIREAARKGLTARPVPELEVGHILVDEVTVAQVADDLAAVLPGQGRVSLWSLTGHLATRIQVIVHFLAVLELFKQGLVEIWQEAAFGAIEVCWTGEGDDAAATATASGENQLRPSELLVDADYRG